MIASRNQEHIDSAADHLAKSYPEATKRIRGHPCDLVVENAEANIVKLFDYATDNGATKIDHIIDTAGDIGPTVGDIAATDVSIWLEAYRIRCLGSALLAKHAIKYMRHEASSSITVTSGILVDRPMKGMGPRITASGAKQVLTRTLAVDLAPIRVNCVSPGAIYTPLLKQTIERIGPEIEKAFMTSSLLGQIGTPEDCAEAYLCSMKNRYMTGTTLAVDGGFLTKN